MSQDRQPAFGSGEWYRTRTKEQLQTEIDGSFIGGAAYQGARAELDRREAAEDRRVEMRWIKRTFWATIILGLAGIVATVLVA